jgi:hypothetical protein
MQPRHHWQRSLFEEDRKTPEIPASQRSTLVRLIEGLLVQFGPRRADPTQGGGNPPPGTTRCRSRLQMKMPRRLARRSASGIPGTLQIDVGRLDHFAPKPAPPGAFGSLQRYKEALAQCGISPTGTSSVGSEESCGRDGNTMPKNGAHPTN